MTERKKNAKNSHNKYGRHSEEFWQNRANFQYIVGIVPHSVRFRPIEPDKITKLCIFRHLLCWHLTDCRSGGTLFLHCTYPKADLCHIWNKSIQQCWICRVYKIRTYETLKRSPCLFTDNDKMCDLPVLFLQESVRWSFSFRYTRVCVRRHTPAWSEHAGTSLSVSLFEPVIWASFLV